MGTEPNPRPAVFLDRDGTLVEEVDHLSRPEDMRLFPFTADAIRLLKESGYLLFVVTNQSGIGRGYFSESDMHAVHRAIDASLPGMLDKYFYCPHLPDAGCRCRKPGTGMFEAACREFQIDLKRSWMIGDKKIDVDAGSNAGAQSILTLTGYGAEQAPSIEDPAIKIADDLLDAVRFILSAA